MCDRCMARISFSDCDSPDDASTEVGAVCASRVVKDESVFEGRRASLTFAKFQVVDRSATSLLALQLLRRQSKYESGAELRELMSTI